MWDVILECETEHVSRLQSSGFRIEVSFDLFDVNAAGIETSSRCVNGR